MTQNFSPCIKKSTLGERRASKDKHGQRIVQRKEELLREGGKTTRVRTSCHVQDILMKYNTYTCLNFKNNIY